MEDQRDRYAEAIAELIEHRGRLRQLGFAQGLLAVAVVSLAIALAAVCVSLL